MKDDHVIEFVTSQEIRRTMIDRESFTLRYDRRHVWLQKACFYVLRKLGAFRPVERVETVRVAFNGRTLMETIYKQRADVARLLGWEPKKLLMGSEDFAQLMKVTPVHERFDFEVEYHIRTGETTKIMGLEVQIIPWMRGILVVP